MKRASTLLPVILVACACVVAAVAAKNAWSWANCIASGRIEGTYSRPLYGALNVPNGASFGASDKLGADYASLFFSAKDYLARSQMYDPKADPSGRPAVTFPPGLIFLTAFTSARLDFAASAIVSNFGQLILFLAVSAYFFRGGYSSWPLRAAALAATLFLALCTPVGVTWFERGQTDLYCASANLLLLKALRDEHPTDFVLAGLFASLKWACLPFFGLAAIPFVFVQSREQTRRLVLLSVSFAVPLLALVVFGRNAVTYVKLVYRSELFNTPTGISLQFYFPKTLSKVLPFCVPLGFMAFDKWWSRRPDATASLVELTFWATAGLVAAGFGTVAYEYRLVSSLFILPLAVDGRSILHPKDGRVSSTAGRILALVFLAYAFRVETTAFLDSVISNHRAVVPLIAGMSLILTCSLIAFMLRPESTLKLGVKNR